MIEIHPSAKVSPLAEIEDSIKGTKITISENVVIDAFVKIKPAGGLGDLFIGKNTTINSGCVLYTGNGITIGEGVAIAANTTLAPVNHKFEQRDIPIIEQGFKKSKGGILLLNDIWIGSNCVLLDGTVIHNGCVIGAMSLVKGTIPEYSIGFGNPFKITGKRL